jgi:purine-binding chemotaxis protein CheW
LQPPPSTANDSIVTFLEGLAAIDDRMVMVLALGALGDGAEFGEAA